MTTLRKILNSSFRKLGVVGGISGKRTATYSEYADGLDTIQSLVRNLADKGTFGKIIDVNAVGDYTAAPVSQRISRTIDDPEQTISLSDPLITPDSTYISIVTLDGNIVDCIFDAWKKVWITLNDLSVPFFDQEGPDINAHIDGILSGPCPLSYRDSSGLSAYIARLLSTEYGEEPINPAVELEARNFLQGLTYQFSEFSNYSDNSPYDGASHLQVIRGETGAQGPIGPAGISSYDLAPGCSIDQFNAALQAATASLSLAPGRYHFYPSAWDNSVSNLTPSLFDVSGKVNFIIEGNGAELVFHWDPLNPDLTIYRYFALANCRKVKLQNLKITMSPHLYTQGYVTAFTGNSITVKPDLGYEPTFTGVDFYIRVDPLTGFYEEASFEDGGSDADGDGIEDAAYPITANGDGTWTLFPPGQSATISAVTMLNPLTVTATAHGLGDGDAVTIAGVTGLNDGSGNNLLNGQQFIVSAIDANTLEIDFSAGVAVDATGYTAYSSGGTIQKVRVSTAMYVGDKIIVVCRKRAGGPVRLTDCLDVRLALTINQSPGVCVSGRGVDGLDIDLTIRSDRPNGAFIDPLYSGGGGLVVQDLRGRFTGNIQSFGSGDDLLNPIVRFFDGYVKAWGASGGLGGLAANQFMANFASPGDVSTNNPTPPRVGDQIEFWDPTVTLVTTLIITAFNSVTGVVTLSGNIPTGYTPSGKQVNSWVMINRSGVAIWRLGTVSLIGGKARCVISQSHDWQINRLTLENGRIALKHWFPASGHHTQTGGARGGGRVGTLIAKNNQLKVGGDSVISIQRVAAGSGGLALNKCAFAPVIIDHLELENYGYTAIYAKGQDVQVGTFIKRNGGLFRALNPRTVGSTTSYLNYDLYACQATIQVGTLISDSDTTYLADTGGVIIVGAEVQA